MKILFVTTRNPNKQGDYLESSILHGLRKVLGENCVDYPKKKIMYHDFSETQKNSLHGRGFSLLTHPLDDISNRNIFDNKFDVILYGSGHMYGEPINLPELNSLANKVWVLDGHDLYGNAPIKINYNGEQIIGNQYKRSFKRELIIEEELVYPTGFGIPFENIRPFTFNKIQLYQKTAPKYSLFEHGNDFYSFDDENEYYKDMSQSWFGLTCKKGGWDCLRHYEILASGSLLLFRDYDKKPKLCSPQNLPCYSYSTKDELYDIMNSLVKNNKPTNKYWEMLEKQQHWLNNFGTTIARAKNIINILDRDLNTNE